jgi:hypothetical protein
MSGGNLLERGGTDENDMLAVGQTNLNITIFHQALPIPKFNHDQQSHVCRSSNELQRFRLNLPGLPATISMFQCPYACPLLPLSVILCVP